LTEAADVVVIGLGPGGEALAGDLAEAGLDVVGIEKNLAGGECPYWGCVPSKMMIRAANLIAETRRVPGMAGASSVTPDWSVVARRIREEATDNWDDKVAVERFERKGGRFVRGEAKFTGPKTVAVDGREFEASRAIIVATGTAPVIPPIDGLADTPYWTNHQVIETKEVPSSLVVLGGGAVGLELAQVFKRFGSDVTVVEGAHRLLSIEEPEACMLLHEIFEREDIRIVIDAKVERVTHDGSTFSLHAAGGNAVKGDRLLVATGRRADLRSLDVDKAGIDAKAKFVSVDGRMRAADGIWAVGDVTGDGAFTHVAMYQARIATADILGKETDVGSYHALPRVTFTDPEVGAVGLTEAQARERGLDVRTGTTQVSSSARGWIHKAGNDGFIKVVCDPSAGVLVGATSAGPHGGEVLSFLALAVHARVPVATLRTMIYAYPTFHRGIEDALRDLGA
jgi:pyruvate/2-oxoglutarate dehydrogenase complex dihydrolipoamide dehydrogenase (E3) component